MLRLAMNRVSAFIYNLGDIKVVEFVTVLSTMLAPPGALIVMMVYN